MYSSPRARRPLGRTTPALAFVALACDGGTGPVEPVVRASCSLTAPLEVGAASLLPAGSDCLSFSSTGRYALAYFDPRFVEGARDGHEGSAPELGTFTATVGWAGIEAFEVAVPGSRAGGAGRTAELEDDWIRLIPFPAAKKDDDPEAATEEPNSEPGAAPVCDVNPGLEIFCQARPWEVGDTLTIPDPFGLLIHDSPRAAEVLVVRDPFVFAVRRNLPEDARSRLRPILARMARVARLRVLPLLRRSLIDKDVYTSAGSRQILIDLSYDEDAVCICGVAIGTYAQGASVSGISIRIPAGPEFEAHRIGLFSHELTHVWQHAFDTERVSNPVEAVAPNTRWAVEGGADFVRQEVLRSLASEPLDSNRDASRGFANPYLDRLIRDFGSASGQIRSGYGQTAGMLRHLFGRALDTEAGYGNSVAAILQGSLEGWFGSPDGTVSGLGLAARFEALGPGFDPVPTVLEYAIANAVDDRIETEVLQNPAVLEAWRRSPGSRFVPAAEIIPRGPGARIRQPAGSVGYVYVNQAGGSAVLQINGSTEDTRWMVVRFE